MSDNESAGKTAEKASEKRHAMTLDERAEKAFAALEKKAQEKDKLRHGKGRQLLEKIGPERLKGILSKMRFSEVFRVLKRNGFSGDKALLADILSDMGVREKPEAPEKLKKVRCRVAGCDGVLKECEGDGGERLAVCHVCGRVHQKVRVRQDGSKGERWSWRWSACEHTATKEEMDALGIVVKEAPKEAPRESPKKEVVKEKQVHGPAQGPAVRQTVAQGGDVAGALKGVFASSGKASIAQSGEKRVAAPAAPVVDEKTRTGFIAGDEDGDGF